MRPDISEFSYGFALTNELVNHYHLASAAPLFPSLRMESRKGYDVRLLGGGVPIFLQFKLSDFLSRGTAAAARHLGVPHYRFHLRAARHSTQHRRLLELEQRGRSVYYAAPMFHTPGQLDSAFRHLNVVARSAFFRPRDIGILPDLLEHSVSFSASSPTAWLLSEPKQLFRLDGISLFRDRRFADVETSLRSDATPEGLGSQLIEILRETSAIEGAPSDEESLPPVPNTPAEVSTVVRMYFGAELFYA